MVTHTDAMPTTSDAATDIPEPTDYDLTAFDYARYAVIEELATKIAPDRRPSVVALCNNRSDAQRLIDATPWREMHVVRLPRVTLMSLANQSEEC
jgi:hypothetical protein